MEGVLAIFQFTAHLNDCQSEGLSLFSLLRCLQHLKRLLIGQLYDHAANMNSESDKELVKLRNSALVCRHVKRKGM